MVHASHLTWPERLKGRYWSIGVGVAVSFIGYVAVTLRTSDYIHIVPPSPSLSVIFGVVFNLTIAALIGWLLVAPLAEWGIHEFAHLWKARQKGYKDARIHSDPDYGNLTIVLKGPGYSLFGYPIKSLSDADVMQAGPSASLFCGWLSLLMAALAACGFIVWPSLLAQWLPIEMTPLYIGITWGWIITLFAELSAANFAHSKADTRPQVPITFSETPVRETSRQYDITMKAEAYQRGYLAALLHQIDGSKTDWKAILPVNGLRVAEGVEITVRVQWTGKGKAPGITGLTNRLRRNITRVEGDERYARNPLGPEDQIAAYYVAGDFSAPAPAPGTMYSESPLSTLVKNLSKTNAELVSIETVSSTGNGEKQTFRTEEGKARVILIVRLPPHMTAAQLRDELYSPRPSSVHLVEPLLNLLIDLHGYRPYITDLAVAAIDGMLHDVMRRVDTKNGKRWVFDTSLDTFHLRPITSKVTTDKEESEFVEKVRKAFVIASDYMGYPDQETRDMGEHPASPQFREIDGVPHIAYNAVRLEIYMRRYGVRYPIDILAEALGHILDRGPLNAWELRKPRLKRERTLELKLKILREAHAEILERIRKDFPDEGEEIIAVLERRRAYPEPNAAGESAPQGSPSYRMQQVWELWRRGTPNDIASIFTFLEFRLLSGSGDNLAYVSSKISEALRFFLPLVIGKAVIDPGYGNDVRIFLGMLLKVTASKGIHLKPFYLQGEDESIVNGELRDNIEKFLDWMTVHPHLMPESHDSVVAFRAALESLKSAATTTGSPVHLKDTAIAPPPAVFLMKALGLDQLPPLDSGKEVDGLTIHRIDWPKAASPDEEPPYTTLKSLLFQPGGNKISQAIGLVYDEQQRLLAIFTIFDTKITGWKALFPLWLLRFLHMVPRGTYLDLTDFWAWPGYSAPGVGISSETQAAVREFLRQSYCWDATGYVHAMGRSRQIWLHVGFDEKGKWIVRPHSSIRCKNCGQAKKASHELIIPIFPGVYSPITHVHDDIDYYEYVYGKLGLRHGDELFVPGPGPGSDTYVGWLRTQNRVFVRGKSELENQNAQATAARAGIPVQVVDKDFDAMAKDPQYQGRFDAVTWNAPATLPKATSFPGSRFEYSWDSDVGGESLKKLVAALPYILKPNTGKALIWARREGYIWNKNNPDVDVIKLLRNGDQNTVIAVGRYTYLVIPNWHTSVPSGSGRRADRNFSNQSA